MTKAEAGTMQLKAKEHQRLPANNQKLGRGEEGFSYRFLEEADTLILDL